MRFKYFCIILLFVPFYSAAQTEIDPVLEPILESIAESAGDNFDYSELAERLNYHYRHKINLNNASREDLQELTFLSPLQIQTILDYPKESGRFVNILELQALEGFNEQTVRQLMLFITVTDPADQLSFRLKDAVSKSENDLMLLYGQVLEPQKGYVNSETSAGYLGSPSRLFVRYRYAFDPHVYFSLNMDKDAGEQFFSGTQRRGFDFYSGSLYLKNLGHVKKVVLGDFSLQFGQGLTLWSGLSFGKGAALTTIPKQGLGLKAYTSRNELLFFRGSAATIQYGPVSFTPFISYRKIDASISDDNLVNSILQTGYHRTPAEINNRNSVAQSSYGLTMQYNRSNLELGLIAYRTGFDHSFALGNSPYQRYEFTGSDLNNAGFYYHYAFNNLYFFGEAAHSFDHGWAFMNGMLASLTQRVSLSVLQRYYQSDYLSFFNQAISESTTAQNEKGFYAGLVIEPLPKVQWSLYSDLFKFPWLKYQVDVPSKGYELFSQVTYNPFKRLSVTARYRLKNKEQNQYTEVLSKLSEVKKQNYRIELSYKLNDKISLSNRAEVVQYSNLSKSNDIGYMVYQDADFELSNKVSLNGRIALFDTPGFDTRIYTYEDDVLYGYSFPAYQNQGLRFYINSRLKFRRGLDLWLRYSLTSYVNQTEVGSALDVSEGDKRSDIKIQLRYQF
ncbi:hypothetical protein GS399_14660 [Pedobacter sp. HMF7647]|uniref:Helix-hairpin-helix domain-containing protein n=1 Tax=Hufsiella arboris TaxID=2695275 RepID=A0A7K1YCA6_9SPHI|nr:helix-hairpin-helix domain-containing protein [Hufsiella arboris]MXV52217.1 hypothetical protein [Hufsiella arboris]